MKSILRTVASLLCIFASAARADDFIISYWCGPPSGADLDAQYAEIAECNFTHAMPACSGNTVEDNKRILDACQKHGLKFIASDSRSGGNPAEPAGAAGLDALVAEYGSHPALGGYFLGDEPETSVFPRLSATNEYLLKKDPQRLVFLNLLPNYATPPQLNARDYDDYLERYCTVVKPRLLCYDHYALFEGQERPSYFQNMEAIRRAGLKHDIPTGFIFLVTPHGTYRDPNEIDLRWQVNTALAYGTRALFYFTYFTITDPAANFHDGILDPQLKRTPHYEMAKRINGELKLFAPTLMQLKSTAVYHTGKPPEGCQALPKDAAIQFAGATPLVFGFFDHADGSKWAMVVNRGFHDTASASFTFATAIHGVAALNPTSGKLEAVKLDGQSAALQIPPGGIKILKLNP